MPRGPSYARDEQGAAAVEFALVIPVAMLLLMAIFHMCFMSYATGSLHWTVEQAARCASVGQQNTGVSCSTNTTTGPSIGDVQNYAASLYKGPLTGVQFLADEVSDATTGYCRRVTGTGNYRIVALFVNFTVPISATACFPETKPITAWS
jgi:Flp pilus assembly protein TadG